MRRDRRADRRSLAAFVAMVVLGAGLLLWSHGQASGASPAPAAAVPGQAAAAAAPTTGSGASRPIVPTRLLIPAIGVDAAVEARGTTHYRNPFTGRTVAGYGVPASMRTTAWWSDGPRPGSGQMAVILGHRQVGGGYGVFNDLDRLRAGDAVALRAADGTTLHLTVLGAPVTGLDKATPALADTLEHHPAAAAVAFVTCGGRFDESVHASEDNDVVFAGLRP